MNRRHFLKMLAVVALPTNLGILFEGLNPAEEAGKAVMDGIASGINHGIWCSPSLEGIKIGAAVNEGFSKSERLNAWRAFADMDDILPKVNQVTQSGERVAVTHSDLFNEYCNQEFGTFFDILTS